MDSGQQIEGRSSHLRDRQRPDRGVSQRRERRLRPALSPMCSAGLFSAIGGLGLTMTTGIGSAARGRPLHAERTGRRSHRRGQPDRRPRRDRRAGHRRLRAHPHSRRPDLPEHRPEFRPGHPGDADRAGRDGGRPHRLGERAANERFAGRVARVGARFEARGALLLVSAQHDRRADPASAGFHRDASRS